MISRRGLCCALIFLAPLAASAQTNPPPPPPAGSQTDIEALKKTAPRVFIDCDYCDIEYIKTEITFVNYVRDRKEAQVHVLITVQSTGAGGVEYTMHFSGQQEFAGMDDVQKFCSNQTQTSDEIRQGQVRVLKMGLMRYVARTPIAEKVGIVFQEKVKPTSVVDKWNFWVFSLSARTSHERTEIDGTTDYFSGSVSANRVTAGMEDPDERVYLPERRPVHLRGRDDRERLQVEELFRARGQEPGRALVGRRVYLGVSTSTYNNLKLSVQPAPAIEYDVFPYSQSTRRQFSFLYRLNFQAAKYYEETIYGKRSESLWNESLSVTFSLKEKWGTIYAGLAGAHYFHDFSKNHLEFSGEISLRLLKGLSLEVYGSYSMIHDQISLPKGQATIEQVLLRRTMLETNYSYYLGVGLSFTFGSIYSNVVNPRFSGGSSGMIYY